MKQKQKNANISIEIIESLKRLKPINLLFRMIENQSLNVKLKKPYFVWKKRKFDALKQ